MYRPTNSPLRHRLRVFSLLFLLLIEGCLSRVRTQDTCTLGDLDPAAENALYSDLRSRHPDYLNLAFPCRGIIRSATGTNAIWVVWMSETSPIGEGIIGAYDGDHTLRDMRITRPIKHIRIAPLNNEIDVLVVREVAATGTGFYEETMSIWDVANLKIPLWSEEVESWLEGLEGRNAGHLVRCVVMLLDLDCDGTKELLVVKSKQEGTNPESIVFGQRHTECTVFSFDSENHEFRVQRKTTPHVLHPPLEEKDNF